MAHTDWGSPGPQKMGEHTEDSCGAVGPSPLALTQLRLGSRLNSWLRAVLKS